MENKEFSPYDSIKTIEDAIKKAHGQKGNAAFYLVLWGTLIALFAFCNFIALKYLNENGKTLISISWIVFPLGGLISYLYTKKTDKLEKAKLLNDSLYLYVWGGVGLCLGIMTIFEAQTGMGNNITLTTLLFGFSSFITGGVDRFKPSLIGGIICILFAGISVMVAKDNQFLCEALGILSATALPGIIMHKRNKTKNV